MSTRPKVVVIGTTSLDFVAASDDGPTARTAAGNSGSNIAVRLATLGWEAHLVALVGEDTLAPLVRADLESWRVDVTGVVSRAGYRTPRVFHVATDSDSHILFECPRCQRPRGHTLDLPHPEEISAATWGAIEDADAVVVDIAQPLAIEAARRTRAELVWYEQSLAEASPAQMREMTASAHVVKVSSDDVDHYRPSEQVDGPHLRLVSRGADGVETYSRAGGGWVSSGRHRGPVPRSVVDTIGAGDAFTAHAVNGMVGGAPRDEWLRDALTAGARACEVVGARGDMIDSARAREARVSPVVAFQCAVCDAEDATALGPSAKG